MSLVLDVNEKPSSKLQWFFLSIQHVFAMFGATVLVPMLTGLDIGVALVASGLGTLIYIGITKGKVPVYIGSSFAYIAAISMYTLSDTPNSAAAFTGLIAVGVIYAVVALIIKFTGKEWLEKLLPPVVVGPMIAVIGLGLAGVATSQAGLTGAEGITYKEPLIALITFATTITVALYGKGFYKIIPFLFGIVAGYVSAVILGVVDLSEVFSGNIFKIPDFNFIFIDYKPTLVGLSVFIPIAFVTIAEHIGDHKVLGEITDKDFLEEPGLHRTLTGDGVATAVSAMIGGPANTTYGENTGVVAMTKVASVWVIGLAAIFAILLGFIAPINELIASIPSPVMGGIGVILFGLIASNGLKVLQKADIDLDSMRNIIIIATMLVLGLGGAKLSVPFLFSSSIVLTGMSLAAVVGIILNLVLKEE